jgi:hypothetical protein
MLMGTRVGAGGPPPVPFEHEVWLSINPRQEALSAVKRDGRLGRVARTSGWHLK